jgi:uncharacterized protein (TIGR03084 family)
MDEILAALGEQHAELAGLITPLDDAGWARPTPCEGWDVADVVLHLAQTDEMALGSLQGRLVEVATSITEGLPDMTSVDDGVEQMVRHQRGAPPSELLARWTSTTDALRAAFAATDPSERVLWVSGELSARTLATTRISETWIHTGDVADALGVTLVPSDRLKLIARLAWRTLPYAFTRVGRELTGPVAFRLVGPAGDAWDFIPDDEPRTTISGDAYELCQVAGRRVDPATTSLRAEGPDAESVLELVRTYAA